MTTDSNRGRDAHVVVPDRPEMDPAHGVRTIRLSPHQMTDAMTATEDLFVLAHLGIPRIDAGKWSLTVDGPVGRARVFRLDELKSLPKKIVESVHQCCGSPLEPTVPTRRVASLRWGGVDLAALLDGFGIDPDARFLWAYGLDGGDFAGASCDWYVKDMPLERLAAGDVLLAHELNGAPLPAEHGFPLRLVVPGYYGTNSVKWLWRLHLAARRTEESPFTTTFYNDDASPTDVAAGLPAKRPVWAIAPESLIVAPAPDAELRVGEAIEIWGWAWSFRDLAAVEVSTDGASYARAELEPSRGWAWRRFSFPWVPAAAGETVLGVRALDVAGIGQPQDGARNAIHTVRVLVR